MFGLWPELFYRLSAVRAMTALVLEDIARSTKILMAVPEAVQSQREFMAYAGLNNATSGIILCRLMRYVSVTFSHLQMIALL